MQRVQHGVTQHGISFYMHTGRFNREIRVKTRRRRRGWTDQGRKVNMRVVSMWGKSIKGISAE